MQFIALALLLTSTVIHGQSYNDQGSTLYITEPACAYYKCEIVKHPGDTLKVNWLNSPAGNVKITLQGEINQVTYTVTESIAGTQSGCYKGDNGKRPCGQFIFTIPKNFHSGKYSVVVTSLNYPDKIGYSDLVNISNPYNRKRMVPKTKKRAHKMKSKRKR